MPAPAARGARRRQDVRTDAPAKVQSWAEEQREKYDLTRTEDQLVALGDQALVLAFDQTLRAEVRLAAMGRFAALVRQLDFESEDSIDGAIEATTRTGPWPKRVG